MRFGNTSWNAIASRTHLDFITGTNVNSTPALSIQNLRYRYPGTRGGGGGNETGSADRWNIDLPALSLAQGEQLLLTGTSGSGKSTLLHLIAGIMDPDQGDVTVSGQRVHSLHGAKRDSFRGKHVGMIFQTFNLLHGFSAIENVMAALMFSAVPRSEHKGRAAKLLNHLGITEHHKTPEQLSVGMQQRVAVARAVACDPVLVLADEPTASLDPENAAGAIELIQQVCREKNASLLCVSHDPAMRQKFARVLSLEKLVAV